MLGSTPRALTALVRACRSLPELAAGILIGTRLPHRHQVTRTEQVSDTPRRAQPRKDSHLPLSPSLRMFVSGPQNSPREGRAPGCDQPSLPSLGEGRREPTDTGGHRGPAPLGKQALLDAALAPGLAQNLCCHFAPGPAGFCSGLIYRATPLRRLREGGGPEQERPTQGRLEGVRQTTQPATHCPRVVGLGERGAKSTKHPNNLMAKLEERIYSCPGLCNAQCSLGAQAPPAPTAPSPRLWLAPAATAPSHSRGGTAEGPRGTGQRAAERKARPPHRSPQKVCLLQSHVCHSSALYSRRCWRVSSGVRPPGMSAKGAAARDALPWAEGGAGRRPPVRSGSTHTGDDYGQLCTFTM